MHPSIVRSAIVCFLLTAGACRPALVSSGPAAGSSAPAAAPGSTGGPGAPAPATPPSFVLPDAGPFDALAAPHPDASCGQQKHVLNRLTPELLLLLDRSSSMSTNDGAAGTRWEETTVAVTEVLTRTDGNIFWGLKTFPNPQGCDVAPGIEVPIGRSPPVTQAIAASRPNQGSAGTPTDTAVTLAVEYLRTLNTPNPKYLVLATDGLPTCPFASPEAFDATVAAIAAAQSAGFPTFVLGISTAGTEANDVLARMAMAGGRPRAGTPAYYPVEDRQSVVDALGQIAHVVESCTFPLDRTAPSPEDVAVNVDGMRVARDPTRMNGWEYGAGNKQIILYGAACDRVKSGSVASLEIVFGCPNMPIL